MAQSNQGPAIVVIQNGMASKKSWKEWYGSSWIRYMAFASVAMCMYLPDQVTTVASKHLTVALNIPSANTGVYCTKLYATKTLVNFIGSLITVGVQMLFTKHITTISCISMVLMGITRIALVVSFFLPNAAVGFYITFIVHSFVRGSFESTFYPLGADDMSTISLSFKGSKVALWAIQVLMDVIIAEQATWMIASHLVIMLLITLLATVVWIVHCKFKDAQSEESNAVEEKEETEQAEHKAQPVAESGQPGKGADGGASEPAVSTKPAETPKPLSTTKPAETPKPLGNVKPAETPKPVAADTSSGTSAELNGASVSQDASPSEPKSSDAKTEEKKDEKDATGEKAPSAFKAFLMRLVGMRPVKPKEHQRCQNGCCNLSEKLVVKRDLTMWQVIRRVISPFFMCVCGWPLKNFFIPGLLPYTLVDRSLCHPINIVRMFFTFIVTFVIHFMKVNIESMGKPWGRAPRGWHMAWLFFIPTVACMPFIYIALHYPQGVIFQRLHDNPLNVGILSVMMSGSTTIIDTMGYIGISACSKNDQGERGNNSVRFIAINSFVMQLIASFTYRMSAGYQIIRRKYVDDVTNSAPTDDMSWIAGLWFWISSTLSQSGYDFVHEFDGNIREFVNDSSQVAAPAS
ncbi:MYOSIN LIGHT CHAIN KINASE domain containing protein, putative [Babesia bigemina]|uniref:MYOSIN LIGHT CHAIN KINASE domain containing protein, putative n=1 Tax=Babesia bigemina TaxID=5866 RepID=A0A061DCJ1_BABBI|nr:MYOSIN LIGHT CHAIN KINASE domain containing protein, putative [Babesia bigemina]CDR96744.1 MYOSIN LIGHT CHAIN KINASE domain containing protein, putative [Babesia bigemina]|eukprot:XP_012768930.1 MYOSIN LIGHT CHAIN KINASE domain containing protein, putative [Babesia bigemina]